MATILRLPIPYPDGVVPGNTPKTLVVTEESLEIQDSDDNFHEERPHFAVYWRANGVNSRGEHTFAAPVNTRVRILQRFKDEIDENGNRIATKMELNVDRDIPVGSVMTLGVTRMLDISPTVAQELLQVVEFEKVADVNGETYNREVKLIRYGTAVPPLT